MKKIKSEEEDAKFTASELFRIALRADVFAASGTMNPYWTRLYRDLEHSATNIAHAMEFEANSPKPTEQR